MKNSITWGKLLGTAFIISLAAGCGNNAANEADGTPDSIESPVMDKQDDKAIAGDSANATGNATTDATGNSAMGTMESTGNSAMGTTDATGNSAMDTTDATANSTTTNSTTP